jgi:hypothetical protein
VAAILLIAPSSHHRLLWREYTKEETLAAANRLSIGGMVFLALAMTGAIFLITDVLFGGVAAVVSTTALFPLHQLSLLSPLVSPLGPMRRQPTTDSKG